MKKFIIILLMVSLLLLYGATAWAVVGIPDHVPAATLIVPMFEVGIDSVANPIDTLLVVTNAYLATYTVHYEVWDVYGNLTDIFGNFTLGPADSQPLSMRGIISAASPAQQAQLTDGAYFHGFVSFDVVTSSTGLWPTHASYPFSSANVLEGYIYYARLTQGSANGIAMVPLEAVSTSIDSYLWGFYQGTDNREEIDADSRYCAERMTRELSCTYNPNNAIYRVHARVYLDPVNNGGSRFVVFTFPDGGWGLGSNFPGSVTYRRYDEAGNIMQDTTVNLNRVVNIINVTGSSNGWVSIWNIPYGYETYAFSINYANHPTLPALNWDAIFEAYIAP